MSRPQNFIKLTGAVERDNGSREMMAIDFSLVTLLDECRKDEMSLDSKEDKEKARRLPQEFTRLKLADTNILVVESVTEILRLAGVEIKA